jgi:hypothetical protein
VTITVIGDNTGDDFAGTEDALLWSASATSNFGTHIENRASVSGGVLTGASCIAFSGLSNISASDIVSDASFNIKTKSLSGGDQNIILRLLLRNWVELQASWNVWSTGNNWTTAGAQSDGNDRSATISSTIASGVTNGVYISGTGAQLISDIQNFIDGGLSNYGWHFGRDDVTTAYEYCHSSDATDGDRPYLSVTHAAGGNITGTSATTNATDTQAAAGTVGMTGTSATTNANDAQSAIGTLSNSGTSATTNANDTQTASGTVVASGIAGAAASTNANDAQAAAGVLSASGASATTNTSDTQAAAGTLGIIGTAATTNSTDVQVASGTLAILGTGAAANTADTQSAAGRLALSGTAASINADDVQAAAGVAGVLELVPGRTFKASLPVRTYRASIPIRTFKAAA